jgi:signal transduction histidine kinase
VWSSTPATVSFTVNPFYWQRKFVQIGFFILGSALVTLLIAAFIKRQHARKIQQFEYERGLEQQRFRHKQAMENERARIAAELHDDLGANLTQIQWLGDAATSTEGPRPGEAELISRISRISRKSREMVHLIDEIVWAVNPKNDTLEQLVTYVCNFAEQYFRDSPTRARIDVTGTIPSYRLEADVRHHLFLIAKEALHNVAKHAATDRVWVRIAIEEGIFKLLIEDHGRGFDVSFADDGDGLANMRRRAQQAAVSLHLDSAPGAGTRITLSLDINPTTP